METRFLLACGLLATSGLVSAGPLDSVTQNLPASATSGSPDSGLSGLSNAGLPDAQALSSGETDSPSLPTDALRPEGNDSGFTQEDNGGTLTLDGSGFIDNVEPVLQLTGEAASDSVNGTLNAQESDDNAEGDLSLSPDGAVLDIQGTGDETIDTNRDNLGIPN